MKLYSRIAGFLFFLLVLFSSVISNVYALTCADNETDIDITCIPNDPAGFTGKFYGIGLGLIGGISVLYIIIGGFFILTSEGDRNRLATGKSYITYAVIGLLLAIFGFVFISVIVGDILRVPGFSS